jgi:hypothetical protein
VVGTSENRHAVIEKMVNSWLRVSRDRVQAYMNDTQFHYQCAQFVRMLHLADQAMIDSQIALQTRDKVLRTILYGGPDEAEAIRRMDQEAAIIRQMQRNTFTHKGEQFVE